MFGFPRFRLFHRPQIATFDEHERVIASVVELFRLPVENELCARSPIPASRAAAVSVPAARSRA